MAPMGNPDLDCSHGDPRAMVPMGNPFHRRLWIGSNGETHVKSCKGNLTMFFDAKICETTHKRDMSVVKLNGMQGLSSIPTKEKKIQQRKESHCRNNSQETKELKEQRMECR